MPLARCTGVAAAIGVHVFAVAFLMAAASERLTMRAPTPIVVRLVTDAPKEEPRPMATPAPRPRSAAVTPPVQPKRVPQAVPVPRLSTTAQTAETQTPMTPMAPAATQSADPESASAAPVTATPDPTSAGPAAPVAVGEPYIPPNFSADYLSNPAPVYPLTSRRFGEEGAVTLAVFVTEQGLPERVELRKSSGFARLDDAALAAVRRWKFVPARRGSAPIAAWVLVPISFSLRS